MATEKITDKNTLKSWFKRGLKPLETQFHAWMDSYWHKSEKIPTSSVNNLETILNKKAETSAIRNVEQLLEQKVDKEQGKELMPSPSPISGTNTFLCEDGTWKIVDYSEAFPELPENADKTYYLSPLLTWEKLPDSVIVLDLAEGADNSKNCNVIIDKFMRNSDVSLSIALRIDKMSFAKVAYVSSTKQEMKLFAYFMTESNGKHILNTYIFTMQINISAGYVSHSVEQKQIIIPAEIENLEQLLGEKVDIEGGDTTNTIVTFTEVPERVEFDSGETLSVMMGKIKRWLSGLGTLAFQSKVSELTAAYEDGIKINYNGSEDKTFYIPGTGIHIIPGITSSIEVDKPYLDENYITRNVFEGERLEIFVDVIGITEPQSYSLDKIVYDESKWRVISSIPVSGPSKMYSSVVLWDEGYYRWHLWDKFDREYFSLIFYLKISQRRNPLKVFEPIDILKAATGYPVTKNQNALVIFKMLGFTAETVGIYKVVEGQMAEKLGDAFVTDDLSYAYYNFASSDTGTYQFQAIVDGETITSNKFTVKYEMSLEEKLEEKLEKKCAELQEWVKNQGYLTETTPSDRLTFANTFLSTTNTPGWSKLDEVNVSIDSTNGLICDHTYLGYKNDLGLTWDNFNEITMEMELNNQFLNTHEYKRIVSLSDNRVDDATGLIYQNNNSIALVLRDNTPNPGWISIYTSEYDWGTFDTWFYVKVYFNISERTMSLTLNDYTKTAVHGWSEFPQLNMLLFGALNTNLQHEAKCWIRNFKLTAN